MPQFSVTDEEVEIFKKAWHEADKEGKEGGRVRAGLAAVFEHHERKMDEMVLDLSRRLDDALKSEYGDDMPEPKAEPGIGHEHDGEQTLFESVGIEDPGKKE